MKKLRNVLGMLLVVTLVASVMLTGCGKTQEPADKTGDVSNATTQSDNGKLDTSKEVALKIVTMSSPITDKDKVIGEINKKLKNDLNATIDVKLIDWGNWETEYKLLLAGGEAVDIIYASSWSGLIDNTSKGAFKDITEVLPTYAPKWYEQYKDYWSNLKINGKIYQMPNPDQLLAINVNGVCYREDLRKKYGVPEIKQFSDLEAYYDAIKKNEPSITPFKVSSSDYWILFLSYLVEKIGFCDSGIGMNYLAYDMSDPNCKIYNLLDTDAMKDFVQLMKTWADKGFWEKGALANKVKSNDSLVQGISASSTADYDDYLRIKGEKSEREKNPSWEYGWYYPTKDSKIQQTDLTANGICFPNSGKNLERALAVVDLLGFDPEYYKLGAFGIKGTHFTENSDGTITTIGEAATHPYPKFGIWGMLFYNSELNYKTTPPQDDFEKALADETATLNNWFTTNQYPNKLLTFAPDMTEIKATQAALSELWNSNMPVFALGLSPDPLKLLEETKAKAKTAGIDNAMTNLQGQLDKYLEMNK